MQLSTEDKSVYVELIQNGWSQKDKKAPERIDIQPEEPAR